MAELLKSFLTVKYKLHNPSQRRRAMLLDTMRRAHLGYDKLLRVCQTDIEELAGIKELKLRNDAYKTLTKKLQDLAKPLPLGNGPKQAIQADVLAQAESYRQLKLEDGNTGYPSVARLNVEETDFEQAIEGLANATTVIEEDEYRDLLATLSRPGLPRPLNILKNRVDGGALILKDHVGRLFVFYQPAPEKCKTKTTSRFKWAKRHAHRGSDVAQNKWRRHFPTGGQRVAQREIPVERNSTIQPPHI
jgi:hypothetical protein